MYNVDETIERFLAAIELNPWPMSADRRVSEETAAVLLGISKGHLRRLRQEGKGPKSFPVGVAGSRVSYRVEALAEWIAVKYSEENDLNDA